MVLDIPDNKRYRMDFWIEDIVKIAQVTPSTLIWDVDEIFEKATEKTLQRMLKDDEVQMRFHNVTEDDMRRMKEEVLERNKTEYKKQARNSLKKYLGHMTDLDTQRPQRAKAVEQVYISDDAVTLVVNQDIKEVARFITECRPIVSDDNYQRYGAEKVNRNAMLCIIEHYRGWYSVPNFEIDYERMKSDA